MDLLQGIKSALVIRKHGKISRAAIELYMAQPNLSRMLTKLEQELGFTLFYRTKSGLKTTEQGERFFEQAEVLLKNLDTLIMSCKEKTRTASLKLATIQSSLFVHNLIGAMQEFINYDIQFYECAFVEIFEAVETEKADVGLVIMSDSQSEYWKEYAVGRELVYKQVCTSPYYLLTSDKNPYFTEDEAPNLEKLRHCIFCKTEQLWGVSDAFLMSILPEGCKVIEQQTRSSNMDFLTSFEDGFMISFQTHKKALQQNHLISLPLPELPRRLEYGYIVKKGVEMSQSWTDILNYIFKNVEMALKR